MVERDSIQEEMGLKWRDGDLETLLLLLLDANNVFLDRLLLFEMLSNHESCYFPEVPAVAEGLAAEGMGGMGKISAKYQTPRHYNTKKT